MLEDEPPTKKEKKTSKKKEEFKVELWQENVQKF